MPDKIVKKMQRLTKLIIILIEIFVYFILTFSNDISFFFMIVNSTR